MDGSKALLPSTEVQYVYPNTYFAGLLNEFMNSEFVQSPCLQTVLLTVHIPGYLEYHVGF